MKQTERQGEADHADQIIIEHDDRAPKEDGLNVLNLLNDARPDDERAGGASEPREPEQAVTLGALLRPAADQEQRGGGRRERGAERR